MVKQGYKRGACKTWVNDQFGRSACQVTLKRNEGLYQRLIESMILSRPEDYFSIYQSGCNQNCLKCHSWEFSKIYSGIWYSSEEIANICKKYEERVTIFEPRDRALMYTASDLCHHCGSCVINGKRGPLCPNKLSTDKVILSEQGFGPARNIVSFTGGDIACRTEFYAEVTEKIKVKTKRLWVLLETNGYGLTPKNLDLLYESGLDSFWLDIKAYDEEVYMKLCGVSNETVLKAPEEIIKRDFVLEVLTVYVPHFVELDQFKKIARLLVEICQDIPFYILAFFPAYKLMDVREPNINEILDVYQAVKGIGLKKVKIGNIGVFAKNDEDIDRLLSIAGKESI